MLSFQKVYVKDIFVAVCTYNEKGPMSKLQCPSMSDYLQCPKMYINVPCPISIFLHLIFTND